MITCGAAPGLTNLLVARAAAQMDSVDAVYIRLYESTDSDDPVSQWSAEVSFDEAVSVPRILRGGRFRFGKRFGEREKFRFPPPIGEAQRRPGGAGRSRHDSVFSEAEGNGRQNRRQRNRPPAALVQTGKIIKVPRTDRVAFSHDSDAAPGRAA